MRFVLSLLLFWPAAVAAQKPVVYEVSLENRIHHEARISVTFSDIKSETLTVRMSRTSPGRYALHEFAKNVYQVRISDEKGNSLGFSRPDLHSWQIAGHGGTVRFEYTLYGNRLDGTFNAIERSYVSINPPAAFVWSNELSERPVRLNFRDQPGEWKIATQLRPTKKPTEFAAPNTLYLMDSPIGIADFTWFEWTVPGGKKNRTLRMAINHNGSEDDVKIYGEMTRLATGEATVLFGALPDLDFDDYTFIAHYLPEAYGDGMEHRNSTILTSSRELNRESIRMLGTVVHEFLHVWNVERLRPASLEPFDFDDANVSGELWFAEGFTAYYDDLLVHRAGLTSLDLFAQGLYYRMNAFLNSPSNAYFSAVEISERAPFVDDAVFLDDQNRENIYLSYYTLGDVIALGLDLTLRTRFTDVTLDDFVRACWEQFGQNETPYTNRDLQSVLTDVTGDAGFAADFFQRYVFGRDRLDYGPLLEKAGLLLRRAKPDNGSLGLVDLSYKNGEAVVFSPTRIGGPLYEAGIDRNDVLLTVGGSVLSSAFDLDQALAGRKPGDTVLLEVERGVDVETIPVVLGLHPEWEVVPFEHASLPITDSIAVFRTAWLGSKAGAAQTGIQKKCSVCNRSFDFRFDYCPFHGEQLEIRLKEPDGD